MIVGERTMEDFFRKITNPRLVTLHLCRYLPFRLISDEAYIKLLHRTFQERKLDLENPISFNEKIEWLKLFDRRPEYTFMTDKYLVREYVEKKIGSEFLIPLLGVWNNVDDIDFAKLPNRFVLKCNHDMGSIIICLNKSTFNQNKAKKQLRHALKKNYFWPSREYNYYDIERKVIAEQFLDDSQDCELTDYKFFCFDGTPRFIQVDKDRFTNHTRNFYSTDWEYIKVENGCKTNPELIIPRPEELSLMLNIAETLSAGYPHIRVDLYNVNRKIYFGELTMHHGGGAMKVIPYTYDELWGSYLHLPLKER